MDRVALMAKELERFMTEVNARLIELENAMREMKVASAKPSTAATKSATKTGE